MEKSSFYADGDVLFHSVLVIDTLHHHHLLSMFFVLIVEAPFVLIVEAPPPNEVSLIELSFPHSFIFFISAKRSCSFISAKRIYLAHRTFHWSKYFVKS